MRSSMILNTKFLENIRIFVDFYMNNDLTENYETKILITEVFKMIKSQPKEIIENFTSSLTLCINFLLYKNELAFVYDLVFIFEEILLENFFVFLKNFNYPVLAKLIKNKVIFI